MTPRGPQHADRLAAIIAAIDAMARRNTPADASTVTHPEDPELVAVRGALAALAGRYEAIHADVVVQSKRHMADMEELQNANRLVTVGTLTVGMAHELGTPLGVVLARAQMIVSDDADLSEARKDAYEIVGQVKRMTQMCRELLEYARPREPRKAPVDVMQLLRQVTALLQLDARKRNARLILEDTGTPCLVSGDPAKLMQVLTNLVINAGQAMPRGGTVTLSVELCEVVPPVTERLAVGPYVCIHVRDTGVGISDAALPRIFDTFFTTKSAGEGTGLGLAVSARIAREHGGFIGVKTVDGAGSTFTLHLPPASAPAWSTAPPPAPARG